MAKETRNSGDQVDGWLWHRRYVPTKKGSPPRELIVLDCGQVIRATNPSTEKTTWVLVTNATWVDSKEEWVYQLQFADETTPQVFYQKDLSRLKKVVCTRHGRYDASYKDYHRWTKLRAKHFPGTRVIYASEDVQRYGMYMAAKHKTAKEETDALRRL